MNDMNDKNREKLLRELVDGYVWYGDKVFQSVGVKEATKIKDMVVKAVAESVELEEGLAYKLVYYGSAGKSAEYLARVIRLLMEARKYVKMPVKDGHTETMESLGTPDTPYLLALPRLMKSASTTEEIAKVIRLIMSEDADVMGIEDVMVNLLCKINKRRKRCDEITQYLLLRDEMTSE